MRLSEAVYHSYTVPASHATITSNHLVQANLALTNRNMLTVTGVRIKKRNAAGDAEVDF